MQQDHRERWLGLARRAFADLDGDQDGLVRVEDMVAVLREKLPPAEVRRWAGGRADGVCA